MGQIIYGKKQVFICIIGDDDRMVINAENNQMSCVQLKSEYREWNAGTDSAGLNVTWMLFPVKRGMNSCRTW